LNFTVDGSLVLLALYCWKISEPLERRVLG